MIVHEYGHAVHHDQVEGFSAAAIDAGAIGESFGDYLAVTAGLAAADQYGWPVGAEEACPMDWDAVSYTNAPHCIRRFDRNLTLDNRGNQGLRRPDLEAGALGDPSGLRRPRLTTADWDTTYILSQFDYAPDTSFQDAAKATYALVDRDDGAAERSSRTPSSTGGSPSDLLPDRASLI